MYEECLRSFLKGDLIKSGTEEYEIVLLKTGHRSLRSLVHGETFHPVIGPRAEAQVLHIEQQKLVERCEQATQYVIWDVGFGAAANVLTAIESLEGLGNLKDSKAVIEIHSFDKTISGVEFALANATEIPYVLPHRQLLQNLLEKHKIQISPRMSWHFHLGDFRETVKDDTIPAPNTIFYDPYSPTSNPDMWTLEAFQTLYGRLKRDTPCLLTNYTRSTSVRVTALLAGLYVGIGRPVGEKDETTVAGNSPHLIDRLLDRSWLERVRISSNSAPLRMAGQGKGPISDSDFEQLCQCPQFN